MTVSEHFENVLTSFLQEETRLAEDVLLNCLLLASENRKIPFGLAQKRPESHCPGLMAFGDGACLTLIADYFISESSVALPGEPSGMVQQVKAAHQA